MAELITVARPYAEAAFRAALEAKDLAGVSDQLHLAAAVACNAQMSALLSNPKVTPAQKRELFFSVTAGKLGVKSGEGFYSYTAGSKESKVAPAFAVAS